MSQIANPNMNAAQFGASLLQDFQAFNAINAQELLGETATPLQDMQEEITELGGRSNSYFGSKGYLRASAKSKQDQLWSEVSRTAHRSGSFPGTLSKAKIFIQGMESVFKQAGDAMKPGIFWGSRQKIIHSVGNVGKVRFIPVANPFSGIFKTGANYGLVRLSAAAKPGGSQPLGPGMGLKFLRDGMDSANLVAMYSVEGQPGDWNFFSNNFWTHIGPSEKLPLKAVAFKFSSATDFVQVCGISDWAAYDNKGQATHVKVPFKLRFVPHSDVHNLFPKAGTGNPMSYTDQLESVKANANLYNVYAWTAPKQLGGKELLIGRLQLDGKLVKSKWADENLFFRHQKQDDDLKFHPAWEKYSPKFSLNGKCPYQKFMEEMGY